MDKIMDKIASLPWFCVGCVCAVVALYLGFQCFFGDAWSLWAWIWKTPVMVFAAMAAIQFLDSGIHGDQPPR